MQNWSQFFTNVHDRINITDNKMNRAQYLWTKLSSGDEIKERKNIIKT